MSQSSVVIGRRILIGLALLAASALWARAQPQSQVQLAAPSAATHVTRGSDLNYLSAPSVSVAPADAAIRSTVAKGESDASAEGAGLVINATFDSTITDSPNGGAIISAIQQAISIYQSMFSDPVTVSILFRYAPADADGSAFPRDAVGVSRYVYYSSPWNEYVSALKSDARSANDVTANASLPATPLSPNVNVSSANGRALGLNTPPGIFANGSVGSGGSYDGIVTINSAAPVQFTRPADGSNFDGITFIEHEIDEVLGLGSFINSGTTDLRPQDLFSWSGPRDRNTIAAGLRYFSIDGGQTRLADFNQQSNGDFGDWSSGSCPNPNPLVQDAFGCRGQSADISIDSPEGITLDVLGYDAVGAPAPGPTASATPASTPTSADQSVTWQNNIQHDGNDATSPLTPPLTIRWQKDLSSTGVASISYPLIADGRIIVTTRSSDAITKSVVAFDETSGQQLWSTNISGTYGFLNAAYDANKVFVVNYDGLIQALDARKGTLLWSVALPNQDSFASPPAVANGIVYIGEAGPRGTLYAMDENNGNVLWTAQVEGGNHSSPAIVGGSVFVSYACPQAYAFVTATGQQLWHFSGGCEGGDGKTAVAHLGKLYVRGVLGIGLKNGSILDAKTGAQVGVFDSERPPAFSGNVAVYFQSQTLRGEDISTGKVLWSFAGDGSLTSAPVIVNRTIYIGSNSGLLYALDLQGHLISSTQVGAPIPTPDEGNADLTTGLGAGDGLLVVPTTSKLVVYAHSSPIAQNISTRLNVLAGNNVMIGGFIITGNRPKKVIVRALGPSTGIAGALADPTLELHMANGTVVTNDNWKTDSATGRSQEAEIRASGVPPSNDRESALVETLAAGSYTAIVRGKNGGTGIGLVEVYDLDSSAGSTLANISTRGFVETSNSVMIGGFIVGPQHSAAARMAIRAIGPSTGVSGALQDPTLELHDGNGHLVATNDNWHDDVNAADIRTYHLAPADPRESAMIRMFPPGAYTAVVRGANSTDGVGLVEVYNIR